MNNISNFLEKFKKFLFRETETKDLFLGILKEKTKIELSRDEIKIKNGIAFLKTKPLIKNEIIFLKEEIIKDFNKKTLSKKINDIK